ncbi:MAG: metal-sulfur cluster assembly factor [Acidimicrobiales bacterium]
MSGEDAIRGKVTIRPTETTAIPRNALDQAWVWAALGRVYDPELGLDVVSLGLVYDVRGEDGTIVVEMTLTTPGCPASESLPEMVRAAIAESAESPDAVDVRIVWDPPWSPALIDEEAAEALGFRVRR